MNQSLKSRKHVKVLQVIPSLSPHLGGPTRAVLGLSYHLQKAGVDVQILTTDDDTDKRLDVPLNKTIDYKGIPTTFLPRTFRAKEFIYSNALSKWHERNLNDFNLVHTHYLFSYLPSWTARAARRQEIPYMMRPLGQLTPWALSQGNYKKKIYARLLERCNLNQAAIIHCTSLEEADNVQQFGVETPMVSIPLGVESPPLIEDAQTRLRQAYALPSNVPIVLFLSRLHKKKQPEVLLEAIAKLIERQPCHLLLAGSGEPSYVKSLEQMINNLRISNQVTFTGFVSGYDKNLLLQGSDVFALPSHSENFGIAVAEALVSSLPVVITPGIQISSEIRKENAGLIVEADAELFSDALYQVINQPLLRAQIRENGLRLASSRYSWLAIAQKVLAIYEDIVLNQGIT